APDGRYLAFSSTRAGGHHLFLADREGRTQKQLTHGAGDDTSPAWSPRLERARRRRREGGDGVSGSWTWRVALALVLIVPLGAACKKKGPRPGEGAAGAAGGGIGG